MDSLFKFDFIPDEFYPLAIPSSTLIIPKELQLNEQTIN